MLFKYLEEDTHFIFKGSRSFVRLHSETFTRRVRNFDILIQRPHIDEAFGIKLLLFVKKNKQQLCAYLIIKCTRKPCNVQDIIF